MAPSAYTSPQSLDRAARAGAACAIMAAASAALLGGLELWHPVFSGKARFELTPSGAWQLWIYGIAQATKAALFTSAIAAAAVVSTRRGPVVRAVVSLAVVGAIAFAIVWIMIAITGRDDAIHLGRSAIGSDGRSNGALLCLWLAPFVTGTAALGSGRVPKWHGVWMILTGLLGMRIFAAAPVGIAFIVEGVLWGVLGLNVWRVAHRVA
jgi:hypothetical protein